MSQHPKEIQTLLNRAAIHDVLARYYQGLDQGNQDQVRACFTDDVIAQFDEKPATRGIDALMDSFGCSETTSRAHGKSPRISWAI